MLHFNHRGLLVPSGTIRSNIYELEDNFITNISSGTRQGIFKKYMAYSAALKDVCQKEITQWINGSFVTQKANPADIDLVSFIPHSIVEHNAMALNQFSYPNSEISFGVDAYIVKIFPENHRSAAIYNGDKLYWLERFSKTRFNRAGNRYPKGFLEINF